LRDLRYDLVIHLSAGALNPEDQTDQMNFTAD